jgi:small conductance mechanosensitive channel
MLTGLLGDQIDWVVAAVGMAVALGVAWAAAHLAARAVRVLFGLLLGDRELEASFSAPLTRRPVRVVWLAVFMLVAAILVVPALELAGAEVSIGLELQTISEWFFRSGLRVVLIILLAYALVRLTSALVGRLEHELSGQQGPSAQERAKRAKTLGGLIVHVVDTFVVGIAGLMVLQELTGAGIVGLAVGFGAQTLVRDFIGGFFLILEDQIRVGDVANINGTGGLVEDVGLRKVVLRDLAGTVHVIPNGAVEKISNLTKDFSYYVIDMGVAYKEDTDHVVGVMKSVADQMLGEPAFGASMQGGLEVLGVDDFGDSAVTIKVRLKTVPLKQWEVGREYRRRVKKAFDAAGIEIPFPHRSIYFGEASKPWQVSVAGLKN